jgi:molybdate transport repressor ModE-like protein
MAVHNRTDPDWEDIRVFLALARHGSLSAAARALGVNHATVSRRIQSLEDAMGESLVERRPDGFVLTSAGTRVLGPANDMEIAAEVLQRGGPDDLPKGLVRLNAPPSLVHDFLVQRLARFTIERPGLDIDVATDVRSVSLERRETDIALRLSKPEDGDIIAKRLTAFGCAFYSNDTWRRELKKGAKPVFVGFDEHNAHLPDALWLGRHFPRARIAFRASNHTVQAMAAREGAGIALLPHFIARADTGLVRCQLEPIPPEREIWMLTRGQDRQDVSIRAVAEFLQKVFADESGLFN